MIRRPPPSTTLPPGKCGDVRLPTIDALAALGPVLCLSRTRDTLLSGWRRAVACEYAACVDSSGMRECLRFRTADGDCCWQLYALPEDDFLAWERLIGIMPEGAPCEMSPCLAERMWRGLSDALLGRRWRASLIRIHAFLGRDGSDQRCLAISQPAIAPFSLAVAHRIAQAKGAELLPLDVHAHPQERAKPWPNAPSRMPPHFDFPFNTGIPS